MGWYYHKKVRDVSVITDKGTLSWDDTANKSKWISQLVEDGRQIQHMDKNIDFNEQNIEGEYAMYVLRADTSSFNKPSDIYGDFNEILNWYKYQLQLMGQKVLIK